MSKTARRGLSLNALAHLLLLAVVCLWGGMFVLVKQTLADISPQFFNALRFCLAFLFLAVLYRSQWKKLTRAGILFGAVTGVCLAAGYFFQTAGLVYTSATNCAFITGLVVVLVPFMASIPGLRPPNSTAPHGNAVPLKGWIGAFIAFAGVALLTTQAHTRWNVVLQNFNRGDVFTLICAVAFALQVIALAHAARRVPFEQLALLQIGFATLLLTAGAITTEKSFAHWSWQLILVVIVAGVLATAVAFTVQTWAQQTLPATNTALLLAMEPVFTWIFAFIALRQHLDPRHATGAALVMAGILLTELLPGRPRKAAELSSRP